MTGTMMTDPAIMVIGSHLAMITGETTMTMIGKSHHRNTPRITTIISMNLQTTTTILTTQTTLKMVMCVLRTTTNTTTRNIMMTIKIGMINMSDMSVPLQFLSWKSILFKSSQSKPGFSTLQGDNLTLLFAKQLQLYILTKR